MNERGSSGVLVAGTVDAAIQITLRVNSGRVIWIAVTLAFAALFWLGKALGR
jgi:hypothetical protein